MSPEEEEAFPPKEAFRLEEEDEFLPEEVTFPHEEEVFHLRRRRYSSRHHDMHLPSMPQSTIPSGINLIAV